MSILKMAIIFATSFGYSCVSPNPNKRSVSSKDNKTNSFSLANRYARDGLFSDSITHYKRAIKANQHRNAALRNMGIVQVKIGDYKNAIQSFESTSENFANNFEFHFYKAEAHRGIKEYDKSIYHYLRADEIKPNQTKVLKPLAWSYFKIRYYAKSFMHGKNLLKRNPKDTQVALIVARTLVKTKRLSTAQKVINRAKKYANDTDLAHLKSVEGDIFLARGQFENATRSYRAALKRQPLLAGALHGIGICLIRSQQVDRGIKYLERSMRIRPEYAKTYFELGKAYENKSRSKSFSYYKQFLKLSKNDPELIEKAHRLKKEIKTKKR